MPMWLGVAFFDLILYVPMNIFQLCLYMSSLDEPVLSKDLFSCSRTLHSDAVETRTRNLSIPE